MTSIATFNTVPATAKDVRSFYADPANADRLANLSEAAQRTVVVTDGKAPRGRIHPEAREDFNSDRKPSQQYNEGAPKTVTLTYKHTQPSGRKVNKKVAVSEVEARTLAGEVAGKRGPLSKAALVAAGEALGAQVAASGE
jgi:hypothetical protein